MKKIRGILLLPFFLLATGCGNQGEKFTPDKPSDDFHINTVQYQDCEYVYVTNPDGSVTGLTHKGNCRNKFHIALQADAK